MKSVALLCFVTSASALAVAPELPAELVPVTLEIDAAEARVTPQVARPGRTEGFLRMWLDDAHPGGKTRGDRLRAVADGVRCFYLYGAQVALEAVKAGVEIAGGAVSAKLLAGERWLREELAKKCGGPGGKAAAAEWQGVAKAMSVIYVKDGPVQRIPEGRKLLAHLSSRGALVGLCGPSGFCAPGWAAPPESAIRPEHVLIGLAALGLGIVPWAEPVTMPALLRLATP